MALLAKILWNPFLCVVYLALGALFVVVTFGVAWRRAGPVLTSAWGSSGKPRQQNQLGHREAFLAALAASVGVGNLAGVATALHLGGPGALFWMWVSALVGMHFRMAATYFAIKHQPKDPDDLAYATPMAYLERFFERAPWLPRVVATLLLLTGVINANLIQSNSVGHTLTRDFGISPSVVGVALAVPVGAVILGGLRSIVDVSARLAPWLLLAYVGAGLVVLGADPAGTGDTLRSVFRHAFHPYPAAGGLAGYAVAATLQFGVSRGIFSHGSGMGMAPFFQAANSDHPARGAFMAAVVPVVDTLVVCTITALVILSNGFWQFWTGAHLTVSAFASALGAPGKLLVFVCLLVFAFTTVVSWAHFSERCYEYLGGTRRLGYRLCFCGVTLIGPFLPVAWVWSLGDVLIGLLLLMHLVPLTMIVLRKLPEMRADLEAPGTGSESEVEAAEEIVGRPA
jgi:AGCS family alanine or glycine:cation symporter